MSLPSRYKSLILNLPRFIEKLQNAYFAAHQHAETFEEAEQPRIRGQLRHYRQNAAFRVAALESGLVAAAPHTNPKGERYALVAAEDIRFGRVGVPFHDNQPRPAKHRRMIAALNSRLEPVHLSLFEPAPTRPSDGLGCLVVTVHPPRQESQSTPTTFLVGVPYTNLRGWHLLEPIHSLIAAYHVEQEIEVPDLAWAKLKVRLNNTES